MNPHMQKPPQHAQPGMYGGQMDPSMHAAAMAGYAAMQQQIQHMPPQQLMQPGPVPHQQPPPQMQPPQPQPMPPQQPQAPLAQPQNIATANAGNGVVPMNGAGPNVSHQEVAAAASAPSAKEDTSNLANTKEKTPMCLINELARFNKVQHQYTLTDESGPAHKKTFFVRLKLGTEEYASSGPSIKKAQHAAAAIALEKTQFKHPVPKPIKKKEGAMANCTVPDSLTPTVMLNALVMRRGEPAMYHHIEMPRPNYNGRPGNMDFRGMYHQRYPRVFYVSLKVGQREFIGMGNSRQAARHDAAAKALGVLQNLPMPTEEDKQQIAEAAAAAASQQQAPAAAASAAGVSDGNEQANGTSSEDALKSEISLVFEIALKRNFTVTFEVTRDSGPPHMKVFNTRCTVDRFQTEAEGNSKKTSKKRAAEKMLVELQRLPPITTNIVKPKRAPLQKKKKRNLIKVCDEATAAADGTTSETSLPRTDPNYGIGINPISRLIQIQQAKKEKEPVYSLVAERGVPRRREFVMQVQVGDKNCSGTGPNKKLAKRNAAEAMLQLLGYSRPSPQPGKPAIKSGEHSGHGEKKVSFCDQEEPAVRQPMPGVLLMPDGVRSFNQFNPAQGTMATAVRMPVHYNTATMATIARELLETGVSMTANAISKGEVKHDHPMGQPGRPKANLMYLAEVMGLQLQFTDFPKGINKTEFLSLASLSTNPPHVSHGAGATIDASHDMAALTALRAIAEMALEVKPDGMASGDGAHVGVEDKRANSGVMKAEQ